MPRKKIAAELQISIHTVKMVLRVLRRLTGQDHRNHRHKDEEQFNHCPQCRSYSNWDTRKLYDEKLDETPEPRRKRKRKEIPESRLGGRTGYIDRQPGEIGSYNCPVCGRVIDDNEREHQRCAYKLLNES